MVGKEVTPKTFSTDLCNQKLFPAATKKRHNGTIGMVGKYHLKLLRNDCAEILDLIVSVK